VRLFRVSSSYCARRERRHVRPGPGLLLGLRSARPAAREVAFSEVLRLIAADDVKRLDVGTETLTATLKSGDRVQSAAPMGFVAANPTFMPSVLARGVVVDVHSTWLDCQRTGSS
jgi:hypothetical protein